MFLTAIPEAGRPARPLFCLQGATDGLGEIVDAYGVWCRAHHSDEPFSYCFPIGICETLLIGIQ